jgi:pilus assembly protein Flp/PilA
MKTEARLWLQGRARGLARLFITDAAGATAIEYSLIGALISLSIIFGARLIGVELNEMLQLVASSFPD